MANWLRHDPILRGCRTGGGRIVADLEDEVEGLPVPSAPPAAMNTAEVVDMKRAAEGLARASEKQIQARRHRNETVGLRKSITPHGGRFEEMSNEELADVLVRQAALQIIYGDELMTPTTLNEATKLATAWAQIAKSETTRRRALAVKNEDTDEADSEAKERSQAIAQVVARLRDSQRKAQ